MIIVQQSTVRFLERFGKLNRILNPGIHFFIPLIDKPSPPVSIMESISSIEHQKVITKDNVEIDVHGFFFYKINDPSKAYYNVDDFERAMLGLSTSVSRAEVGKITLDEIFQQRETLNEHIKMTINENTENWGIECLNFEMLTIDPPTSIKKALLEVASEERRRRGDIIKSEADQELGMRKSTVKRDAEIMIQQANLEGVKVWNEFFKKSLNELEQAFGDSASSAKIKNYLLTEEYISRLHSMMRSKNLFVLPTGTSGSDNSVALMLAMLAKNNFGGQSSNNIDSEKFMNLYKKEQEEILKRLKSSKKETSMDEENERRFKDDEDNSFWRNTTVSSG